MNRRLKFAGACLVEPQAIILFVALAIALALR